MRRLRKIGQNHLWCWHRFLLHPPVTLPVCLVHVQISQKKVTSHLFGCIRTYTHTVHLVFSGGEVWKHSSPEHSESKCRKHSSPFIAFSLSSHKSTLGTWGLSKKKKNNLDFIELNLEKNNLHNSTNWFRDFDWALHQGVQNKMSTSIAYKMSVTHRGLDRWMASLNTETQAFQNKSITLLQRKELGLGHWKTEAQRVFRINASISMLTCHW